jgi:hypothetical protein
MMERRCKHCPSQELDPSRPAWWESCGLALLVRPVRCHHCERRQYVPANLVIATVTIAFCRFDAFLDRLHPEPLLRLLGRTRETLPPHAEP